MIGVVWADISNPNQFVQIPFLALVNEVLSEYSQVHSFDSFLLRW